MKSKTPREKKDSTQKSLLKKRLFVLGISSLLAFSFYFLFFSSSPVVLKVGEILDSSTLQPVFPFNSSVRNSSSETQSHVASSESFHLRFQKELQFLGQVDPHPEETEKKLQSWAEALNDKELKELESLIKDSHRSGDERMLSVYLLSRNQTETATSILETLVLSSFRAKEVEISLPTVLKMQALEGLETRLNKTEALQSLSRLEVQLKDRDLLDRVHRSVWHLRHQAPSTKEQDLRALRQLVQGH